MPCPPAMCARRADCNDHHCPGHPMQCDEPLVTHEQAEGWVFPTVVTVLVFAFAGFCAVAYLGAPLVFPFN